MDAFDQSLRMVAPTLEFNCHDNNSVQLPIDSNQNIHHQLRF